jgi:hypothetical protein
MQKFLIAVLFVSSLSFALKSNELGVIGSNFYNVQYTDQQNLALQGGFFYTYQLSEDWGFGIESLPVQFRYNSQRTEPKAADKSFTEKIGISGTNLGIYIQRVFQGLFLGTDKRTFIKIAAFQMNNPTSEFFSDENRKVLDDYYLPQAQYSGGIQNYSTEGIVQSLYGGSLSVLQDVYTYKDSFTVSLGLSATLMQYQYLYRLHGMIYNQSTLQFESLDHDTVSEVRQILYSLRVESSYHFNLWETVKKPVIPDLLPVPTSAVTMNVPLAPDMPVTLNVTPNDSSAPSAAVTTLNTLQQQPGL